MAEMDLNSPRQLPGDVRPNEISGGSTTSKHQFGRQFPAGRALPARKTGQPDAGEQQQDRPARTRVDKALPGGRGFRQHAIGQDQGKI